MNRSVPAWTPNARAPRALLIGLGLSLLLATAASHADGTVYKWTDAQGRVHYSDRPPADGAAPAGAFKASAVLKAVGEQARFDDLTLDLAGPNGATALTGAAILRLTRAVGMRREA